MPEKLERQRVETRVRELAAEEAGVNPAVVTLEDHLFEDLNFDSLAAVEFTMKLEDEFEVCIPDEVATEVKTVRHAVEMLMSRLEHTSDAVSRTTEAPSQEYTSLE